MPAKVGHAGADASFSFEFGKPGSGNGQFSGPHGVVIDSEGNIWVVDTENNRVQEFSPEGKYLSQFGTRGNGEGQFEVPTGIANSSPWHFLVVDTENNRVTSWSTKPDVPGCTTSAATSVGSEEATLSATVNPNGAATEYHFEYDTTTEYGTNVPALDESVGSGIEDKKVSKVVKELTSKTTYHFRVACKNAGGSAYGKDLTFTMP